MRALVSMLLLAGMSWAFAQEGRADTEDKIEDKLERLMEAMPGTADIMIVLGERYQNLYWAGRQGKWEFAAYQMEEMEALLEKLIVTRPKRAPLTREFLERGFAQFPDALEQRDWQRFANAFEHMRTQCMVCHAKTDHAFITLPPQPKRAASPVLNLD